MYPNEDLESDNEEGVTQKWSQSQKEAYKLLENSQDSWNALQLKAKQLNIEIYHLKIIMKQMILK